MGSITYRDPHTFIQDAYGLYRSEHRDRNNPSTNGRIFEYLVCETLAREGISPFYYQAKFERVPNADFDVALYNPKRPVVLTMKTSLRERYKQADLEGSALRQVYRNAENYLITLSEKEAMRIKNKIIKGDVAGLTECIIATKPEYDELLHKLKDYTFSVAEPVMPIEGNHFTVSSI